MPSSKEIELINKLIQKASPTQAQIESGNYKKHHVKLHGFDIAIENKKGSVRSGVDSDGKEWSSKMTMDYGYIKGTMGNDGDHVDVFVGPDKESEIVYVINQSKKGESGFDEHKVMFGFYVMDEAVEAYLNNYDDGWKENILSVEPLTIEQFREWLKKGSQNKPVKQPSFLKAIEELIKAKRREEGEVWTQPSGRQVTKKGGKIVPFTRNPSKKFDPSSLSPSGAHNINKLAKLANVVKSKITSLLRFDKSQIDDIQEYIFQEGFTKGIKERLFFSEVKYRDIEDISSFEMSYGDMGYDYEDYEDLTLQEIKTKNMEIFDDAVDFLLPDFDSETPDAIKSEYDSEIEEILKKIASISGKVKSSSYDMKESFLKDKAPSSIHLINGFDYYAYYKIGEYGFHSPVKLDSSKLIESNGGEKKYNIQGNVIPVESISMDTDNWDTSEGVSSKIKSVLSEEFKKNGIKISDGFWDFIDEYEAKFDVMRSLREEVL